MTSPIPDRMKRVTTAFLEFLANPLTRLRSLLVHPFVRYAFTTVANAHRVSLVFYLMLLNLDYDFVRKLRPLAVDGLSIHLLTAGAVLDVLLTLCPYSLIPDRENENEIFMQSFDALLDGNLKGDIDLNTWRELVALVNMAVKANIIC